METLSYAQLMQRCIELTEQRDAVVAESAQLKSSIKALSFTAEECELNGDKLRYVVGTDEFESLTDLLDETTATSAILDSLRAEGADMCMHALVTSDDDDFTDAPNICATVARQLRESKGAQS